MKTELIKFDTASIEVAVFDGKPWVALKPICDALGLDWPTQRVTIKNDPVLSSTVGEFPTVAADGKPREMISLPLDFLNGWLFKINANRYKGERRALIIKYQKECYRVLARHFLGAATQTASPAPALAPGMAALREAVERAARGETAALRYELHAFCLRKGITDPDELLELARAAMGYPGRDKYPTMPAIPERWQFGAIHPATLQRCIARAITQANK